MYACSVAWPWQVFMLHAETLVHIPRTASSSREAEHLQRLLAIVSQVTWLPQLIQRVRRAFMSCTASASPRVSESLRALSFGRSSTVRTTLSLCCLYAPRLPGLCAWLCICAWPNGVSSVHVHGRAPIDATNSVDYRRLLPHRRHSWARPCGDRWAC